MNADLHVELIKEYLNLRRLAIGMIFWKVLKLHDSFGGSVRGRRLYFSAEMRLIWHGSRRSDHGFYSL